MSMIPLIASIEQLDSAIRYAEGRPSSRWYVTKRAVALGEGDRIPKTWGTRGMVAAVDTMTAAGWNSGLHPRGRDGRFIKKGAWLNLFSVSGGKKPEARVKAVGSRQDKGQIYITVEHGDGRTEDVPVERLEAAPDAKATLDGTPAAPEVEVETPEVPDRQALIDAMDTYTSPGGDTFLRLTDPSGESNILITRDSASKPWKVWRADESSKTISTTSDLDKAISDAYISAGLTDRETDNTDLVEAGREKFLEGARPKKVSRADAAAEMFGKDSPQHRKAMELDAKGAEPIQSVDAPEAETAWTVHEGEDAEIELPSGANARIANEDGTYVAEVWADGEATESLRQEFPSLDAAQDWADQEMRDPQGIRNQLESPEDFEEPAPESDGPGSEEAFEERIGEVLGYLEGMGVDVDAREDDIEELAGPDIQNGNGEDTQALAERIFQELGTVDVPSSAPDGTFADMPDQELRDRVAALRIRNARQGGLGGERLERYQAMQAELGSRQGAEAAPESASETEVETPTAEPISLEVPSRLARDEIAVAIETQGTDGTDPGMRLEGNNLVITDPEKATWTLQGPYDIAVDNYQTDTGADKQRARRVRDALIKVREQISDADRPITDEQMDAPGPEEDIWGDRDAKAAEQADYIANLPDRTLESLASPDSNAAPSARSRFQAEIDRRRAESGRGASVRIDDQEMYVGDKVRTEHGLGTIKSHDRGIQIELDNGENINIVKGTPGHERLRPAEAAPAAEAADPAEPARQRYQDEWKKRARDRYTKMSLQDLELEREHQREMLNNENLDGADIQRASDRLDIIDEVRESTAADEKVGQWNGWSDEALRTSIATLKQGAARRREPLVAKRQERLDSMETELARRQEVAPAGDSPDPSALTPDPGFKTRTLKNADRLDYEGLGFNEKLAYTRARKAGYDHKGAIGVATGEQEFTAPAAPVASPAMSGPGFATRTLKGTERDDYKALGFNQKLAYTQARKNYDSHEAAMARAEYPKWQRESPIIQMSAQRVRARSEAEEPTMSAAMQEAVSEIDGAELYGFDFRLKDEKSLARKISERAVKAARGGSVTPDLDAEASIADSLRYTVSAPDANYTDTLRQYLAKMQDKGFTLTEIDNKWSDDNASYHALHLEFETPGGLRAEVQYHTPASLDRKWINHFWYDFSRDTRIPMEIRQDALSRARQTWMGFERPNGWNQSEHGGADWRGENKIVGGVPSPVQGTAVPPEGWNQVQTGQNFSWGGNSFMKVEDGWVYTGPAPE